MRHLTKHFSSAQIIIIGFAGVILLGSLLLMLPFATRDGQGAGFADALFTATSAVCVTGLIVRDTATYWSEFGQAVILALIQIGGMGVITVAVAVTLISGKKISLKQRSTMQDAISAPQVGGIVRLTKFILRENIGIVGYCKGFGRNRDYSCIDYDTMFCQGIWNGKRLMVWYIPFGISFLQCGV